MLTALFLQHLIYLIHISIISNAKHTFKFLTTISNILNHDLRGIAVQVLSSEVGGSGFDPPLGRVRK